MLHTYVFLFFSILYGHHRQVVALFCVAHKLFDGLFHGLYDVQRVVVLAVVYLLGSGQHALVVEEFATAIGGLCQSVGIEE